MLNQITAPVRTIRILTSEGFVLVYEVQQKKFTLSLDSKDIERRNSIRREISLYAAENASLAADSRYSDNYYFRLAQLHALAGDWQEEWNCLQKITDKDNPVYAERIALNGLHTQENSDENCRRLYELNTESSVRKLCGFYMAAGRYEDAARAFGHWQDEHPDEEPGFGLLCQAGLLLLESGKLPQAVHLLRRAFWQQGSSAVALMLATVYYALSLNALQGRRHECFERKARRWLKISLSLDPGATGAIKLACRMYCEGRVNGDGGEKLLWLSCKLKDWLDLPSSRRNPWYFKGLLNLGLTFFIDGEYYRSLEVLRLALQDHELMEKDPVPRYASVWHNIALCQLRTARNRQDMQRAVASIGKAVARCAGRQTQDAAFAEFYRHIQETEKRIKEAAAGCR